MTQQVKVLANKLYNLSSISRSQMVEGDNPNFQGLSSYLNIHYNNKCKINLSIQREVFLKASTYKSHSPTFYLFFKLATLLLLGIVTDNPDFLPLSKLCSLNFKDTQAPLVSTLNLPLCPRQLFYHFKVLFKHLLPTTETDSSSNTQHYCVCCPPSCHYELICHYTPQRGKENPPSSSTFLTSGGGYSLVSWP